MESTASELSPAPKVQRIIAEVLKFIESPESSLPGRRPALVPVKERKLKQKVLTH